MIRSIRQAPLRLFLALAVAVVGLMTVADLPSASPVHAQEQAVTATRDATGESPPARPTDLQAAAGPDSVSLTWTASTDQSVTHYAVLLRDRDKADAGVFEVIDGNAGSATSYTDGSVSPGGSYVYRVKAVSPTGVSQWSSYARADIPADPEDLAPSGLSAKAVFDGGDSAGVELAWDAPAVDAESVTGYEILRAVGDGDLTTLVADTGSADTTYADDTATEPGERYAYRVKALRGEETSQPSDRAEASIPKVTVRQVEPPIAEEQNAPVWSATLTPTSVGGNVGCSNQTDESDETCVSRLTDTSFDYDGTTYSVDSLFLYAGTLYFNVTTLLTAATIADLTLNIGNSPFTLSSSTGSGSNLTWPNSGLTWAADSDSIAVSLTEGAAADVAPLSELSLSGVSLSPSFAADTLTYTGSVGNAVTSTTVTATANDDGATVAIVPADADDTADGHQVDLAVGDTAVSVTVTAEDGTTTQTYTVTVTRAAAEESAGPTVPVDWGLKPSGLGAGDRFRLIFISSTTRDGSSSDIADYNTFVQGLAAEGHNDIRSHSSTFRVVGSTADVDARDNTGTTYTADDKGVAIYWLGGAQVADQYEDFYDGDWDDEANAKDESGDDRSTSGNANFPFTGSGHDGTEGISSTISRALGAAHVLLGRPNSTFFGSGPLSGGGTSANANARPLYGLSGVFVVEDQAALSALSLSGVTLSPSFAANTQTYTGSAGDAVASTTVTATANHDGATVAIVPADADAATDGHQVTLDFGDTAISVTVTAEDGTTTQTYAVTVTRAAAEVQTTAWVSNTAQALDFFTPYVSLGHRDKRHTQRFWTGSDSGGYSLGSVGVYVHDEDLESGETFTVHIYTANADGATDTLVHTLISPDSYADGAVNLFTAPADATLTANTFYLVVFEATGNDASDFQLGVTVSTSEDSGSAKGWSIEDNRRFDNGTTTGIFVISVNAPGTAVTSDDATLNALSLSGVTLSPSFAADTLTYTGSVGNDVTSTTVTATATHDGATVAIVPADADDTADGHQVTLDVGDTAVSVTVTSADGTTTQTYAVTVTRAEAEESAETTVPADWSLIPSGLGAGDRFRLIFISSTARTRDGSSTDIADYNTFVQDVAAEGHNDIRSHSSTFRVAGSTADVDARDNTATRYAGDDTAATDDDSDLGVAIYWLDGNKVADQYKDFYDGDWDDEANAKDEDGNNRIISGNANFPFTGSGHDGTENITSTFSRALGAAYVRLGRPNSTFFGSGPLCCGGTSANANFRPLYGLSAVFRVAGTAPNTPPKFPDSSPPRVVPENSPPDTNVGDPVTATDADDDTLTYTLEGTDAASFAIVSTSGQIQTKAGVAYDHEAQSQYSVTVKADDGNGGTDTIAVTVNITDVNEPPSAPAEPTVEAVDGSSDSLSVTWTAPDNSGKPDIESYDLQYRKGTTGDFTDGPQDVTGLTTTINGLDAESPYQVRVRASNAEGNSGWSSAGTGTTGAVGAPAVSDVDVTSNPGGDDTYAIGDTIQVSVTFDQAVTVDRSGGTPRIQLRVGGVEDEHLKWADYTSGSGNEALLFAYTVEAGDFDDNGIDIAADELELNGGTIQSSGGTDANLDYPAADTPERRDLGRRQLDHHHLQRAPVRDHRPGERLHPQRGHGHGAGGHQRCGERPLVDARAGQRGDQQPGGDGGLCRRQCGQRLRRGPGRGRQRRRELHHR